MWLVVGKNGWIRILDVSSPDKVEDMQIAWKVDSGADARDFCLNVLLPAWREDMLKRGEKIWETVAERLKVESPERAQEIVREVKGKDWSEHRYAPMLHRCAICAVLQLKTLIHNLNYLDLLQSCRCCMLKQCMIEGSEYFRVMREGDIKAAEQIAEVHRKMLNKEEKDVRLHDE